MKKFTCFNNSDIEFFMNMLPLPSEGQKIYYNNNKDHANHIDKEFDALFKDIELILKIRFNYLYRHDQKPLWQGYGRDYSYTWGCFHTKERKRQIDLQLFMEFGLFNKNINEKDKELRFKVGLSLHNIDDELYERCRKNLKLNENQIKNIFINSKNNYQFEDDNGEEINGNNVSDKILFWIKYPGSVYFYFLDQKTILDTNNFVEKVESIMLELYPIFDMLVKKEGDE